MGYRIVRPTTHQEWLDERKKGIGSSDAGTIMGVSPFNTPYGLWNQKKGYAPPFKESDAMFNGHILEPATAEWFEKKTGYIVDKSSEGDWIAVDADKEYLRVSPDRICYEPNTPEQEQVYKNGCVLEIKSTSKAVSTENIPDYWFCQIQYQMGILGLKKGFLCWITGNPTLQFGYVQVDFNEAFFNTLISKIERFWLDNIIGNTPPAVQTSEDVITMFPENAKGKKIPASETVYQDWKNLKNIRETIKELQEEEESIIDRLKVEIKDAETVFYEDENGENITLMTWKNSSKEVFDKDRFKKEEPELYQKYLLTSEEFDVSTLAKQQKAIYKKYCTVTQGTRRFSVK